MFALALWDRREKVLTLARDRMGEKPLYYGWQDGLFLFGSELKALAAHPDFRPEIDRDALTLLLRYGVIPAPYSIYRGISKLQPGSFIQLPLGVPDKAKSAVSLQYWSLNGAVAEGVADPFRGDEREALDRLETILGQSVAGQMLSDVPLGAFLSGGIDSSAIVALMQVHSRQPVKTFTIGFTQEGFNEAEHAKSVARHLGTEHTELYVSPEEALAVIPRLPSIYCEPFADSSQIPTFLVSQMARQHVTVALSGDGGDELFGGYNRYLAAHRWQRLQQIPLPLRKTVARLLLSSSPASWDRRYEAVERFLPGRARVASPGEKIHKLASVLGLSGRDAYLGRLTSQWDDPAAVVIDGTEPETLLSDAAAWPTAGSLEEWMMAMDAQGYMPDDILVKVDRAAMANSLETRVPMLDHRVVEFAWRLPLEYKIRQGEGKWLLRQLLYRHVPKALIERPKQGFAIPLGDWLRGPLRDWAESLLDESRLGSEGFFHPEPIRQKWSDLLAGKGRWEHHLWTILMFQAWLEEQGRVH
jgi:asparagine synthase (glutamine-hydrolysing)